MLKGLCGALETSSTTLRFTEWSQASWELQRDYLLGEDGASKWDVHFMSIYHDSDAQMLDTASTLIAGRALNQWWDKADGSGPASRATEPFLVELPTLECLAVNATELKPLCQHIMFTAAVCQSNYPQNCPIKFCNNMIMATHPIVGYSI